MLSLLSCNSISDKKYITFSCLIITFSLFAGCGGGGGGGRSSSTQPATTYTLSGTIIGVSSDTSGLALVNRNTTATIAANGGSFSFSDLAMGSTYDVVVQSSPAGLTCTVVEGSGTLSADVANVVVTCGYTLTGGIIHGSDFPRDGSVIGLIITNSANDDSYTLTENGSFTMPMSIPYGSAYNLAVTKQPGGLNCTMDNGSGVMSASDVRNITVTCVPWFISPQGVAVDASGNVYVADDGNNVVKRIAAGTGTVTTLASGFSYPAGVAVDSIGNVYVGDLENNAVKKIEAGTGVITTLGSGFSFPAGVAVDASGNVYVADGLNNGEVKKIAAGTGTITTLASGFYYPAGVAVDASGNVYVADSFNNLVKKIEAGTGTVTTLGSGFYYPHDVAVDTVGNVYVTDQTNTLRQIAAGTGAITTLASSFNYLNGVAVDTNGNVYVSDMYNNWVQEILKGTGTIITLP